MLRSAHRWTWRIYSARGLRRSRSWRTRRKAKQLAATWSNVHAHTVCECPYCIGFNAMPACQAVELQKSHALSTQRAASCAQRWPSYHPVHVRFMFCASCADVMDKRYRGGATKLMCWRPLNMMWQLACKRSFNGEADLACPSLTPVLAGTSKDGPSWWWTVVV